MEFMPGEYSCVSICGLAPPERFCAGGVDILVEEKLGEFDREERAGLLLTREIRRSK